MSVEDNDSLLRVGVAFQSMEARHRVSEALERNYERCESFSFFQKLPTSHRKVVCLRPMVSFPLDKLPLNELLETCQFALVLG